MHLAEFSNKKSDASCRHTSRCTAGYTLTHSCRALMHGYLFIRARTGLSLLALAAVNTCNITLTPQPICVRHQGACEQERMCVRWSY